MAIDKLQIAPNFEERSSTLNNLDKSILKKNFLHKAQNPSAPTMYNVFKFRSLFLHLLKVAFLTSQKPQRV